MHSSYLNLFSSPISWSGQYHLPLWWPHVGPTSLIPTVMDIFFSLYFSHFFPSHSMYLCLWFGLSHFIVVGASGSLWLYFPHFPLSSISSSSPLTLFNILSMSHVHPIWSISIHTYPFCFCSIQVHASQLDFQFSFIHYFCLWASVPFTYTLAFSFIWVFLLLIVDVW